MNFKILQIAVVASGMMLSVSALAQPAKRTSAYYAYKEWKDAGDKSSEKAKKSLLEAKTLIDECYAYSSAKFTGSKDGKTLYYKGQIYSAFQTYVADGSMSEHQPMKLIAEGLKSFKEHIELPNKKSKDNYEDEIRSQFLLMRQQAVIGSEQLFNEANKKLNSGNKEGAAKAYKMALTGYSGAARMMNMVGILDTNSYYAAGLCGYYAEEWGMAADNLKVCVESGFAEPGSSTLLAQCLFGDGKGDEGVEVLRNASKKFPKNADIHITEGNYWLTQKDNEKASAAYDRAIEVDPKNETVYYTAGAVNFENEKYELAEEYLLKAVELKPDYSDALYNLGALYNNKAFEIEEQADIANSTMNPEQAKEKKALLLKAVDYWEQVRKIEPNDKATLRRLYRAYGALEMPEKSKEIENLLVN